MCQPRSQGGKRCLRHAAGTRFSVRHVVAKTGASTDMVYDTVKELNKEGRRLPAPSEAEVKEFLDRSEFVTSHDPDLEQKDRNNILKNINVAREEAEKQGVTGGAFHAWKNLMKRVLSKMSRGFKVGAAVGLVSLIAACGSGDQPPANTTEPTATQPGTSQTAEPSGEPLVDSNPEDQFVPLEMVTDEYGEYQRQTIDPNSDVMQLDPSVVDMASFEANGLTEEDALEMQRLVVQRFVEDSLDGTRLDNYSQPDAEWIAEHSEHWSPEYLEGAPERGALLAGMAITDVMPEPTTRDGDVRGNNTIQLDRVIAYKDDNGNLRVAVAGAYTSTFTAQQDTVLTAYERNTGQPASELLTQAPWLEDEDTNQLVVLSGTFEWVVNPETKKLTGSYGSIDVAIDEGISIGNPGLR